MVPLMTMTAPSGAVLRSSPVLLLTNTAADPGGAARTQTASSLDAMDEEAMSAGSSPWSLCRVFRAGRVRRWASRRL